jgi:hypothetical protein
MYVIVFIRSFVRPTSPCKWNSSEVIGPIALMFGTMIDHGV